MFDIGATGQNNTPQCEYFSLLMMSRSGLEQSVVRTGLWPVSWAWSGQTDCFKRGREKNKHHFWWLRGGGGQLHMKPWTQKMDKTIAWSRRGDCMVCVCVCFQAYLITVKLRGKMRKWWCGTKKAWRGAGVRDKIALGESEQSSWRITESKFSWIRQLLWLKTSN